MYYARDSMWLDLVNMNNGDYQVFIYAYEKVHDFLDMHIFRNKPNIDIY